MRLQGIHFLRTPSAGEWLLGVRRLALGNPCLREALTLVLCSTVHAVLYSIVPSEERGGGVDDLGYFRAATSPAHCIAAMQREQNGAWPFLPNHAPLGTQMTRQA